MEVLFYIALFLGGFAIVALIGKLSTGRSGR